MVYIYFVQEAFLAQLRFHGDTLVNYLILRFVLHINRHLKSRKERNPRASAKFSMKQTCEVTVDGLEMWPVLVLALCKRVPNDIGNMLY